MLKFRNMKFCCEKRTGLVLLCLLLLLSTATSCRKPAKPAEEMSPPLSGEPETYSATVVHTTEDGDRREEVITRIVVAPDKRREEWAENGKQRVAILRFDTGKSYLLDVENQVYTETDLNQAALAPKQNDAQSATGAESDDTQGRATAPAWMTNEFKEEPESVETIMLPETTFAGERCTVSERRARFADGRMEITKIFRAERLGGLIIKTEAESIAATHRVKLISERRDLKFEISANEFAIPTDFKKAPTLTSTGK